MTFAPTEPKNVETALADPAFAALSGGPIFVAAGVPPRILHASPQALALFGVRDADALTRRLFSGSEPGARRIAELAAGLAPGAPRLERLRFYVGGASEALTFQCKRLSGVSPLFVAAAIGVRPALLAGATPAEPEAVAQPATGEAVPQPVEDAAVPDPSSSVRPEPPRTGSARFLWKTDSDLRFTRFDDAGCDALGVAHGSLLGRNMLDLAGMPGFDPDGRLCAALLRRETWSGVEVNWPLAKSGWIAPVVMGALPTFDRERAFTGFSGFGVVHLDRAREAAPKRNDELEADIAQSREPEAEAEVAPASPPDAMAQIASLLNDPDQIDSRVGEDEDLDAPEPDALNVSAHEAAQERADEAPAQQDAEEPQFEDAPQAAAEPVKRAQGASVSASFMAPNVVALNAWKSGASAEFPRAESIGPAPPASEPSPQPARGQDEFAIDEEEELVRLTPTERHAFREIARALGARLDDAEKRRERRDRRKDDLPASSPAAPSAREEAGPLFASAPADAAPAESGAARRLLDRVDALVMVCREGEAVYLNRPLLETLGYDGFDDFVAAGGVARLFRGRTPEAASSGGAIPVARRDGETIALEGKLTSIDWDGAPAMLTTFRRPAEAELNARARALELDLRAREAEGRELNAILDTATDGVAVLDASGRILGLNRSAEALFGYEQNEIAGESFTMLFATESHPAAVDYLTGLRSNGVRSVLNDGREVLGRARQGGLIPIFMTIGRVGSDATSKFCVVMRDMTHWKNVERELKDARAEAEKASALKSDFLTKISHEIRTPLNAILGFTEVILEERFGPVGNERYKDYLKDIHASGTHVMSLVNDLLDLSKIEAGKLELNFGSVDANRIINECVSIMQAQAIRERVIIRLSLAPRFPNIVADERALRQIVLNLLSNAVKFNQPGGQVIVSTALTDAGAAVLRVRDNGIGMNDKEVETALEPFRQIQTSRPTTGTGLGLPLTKALVEANRAAFTIRSRKGEGTLVEVSFPSTRVLAE